MRRLALILAVFAALLGAFGAASAQAASPWTLTNLKLGDRETIFGMHCESSSCIGVGQEGVIIQSTAPTAGAGAWTVGHVTPAGNLAANLRGISCPSQTLCVAVDFSGGVWATTDPGAGAASWTPTRIPKTKSLFAVNCSQSLCILVGAGGLVVTSTNPTGGPSAWTRATLPGEPPLRALSCVGALCVASAFNGEIWTSLNPAGGAAAWTSQGSPAAAESPMLGLTCQSESLCIAGNEGGVFPSTNPTGGTAAWPFAPLQRRFQIVAAACPSATLCILTSNNGEVTASTNPTGGSQTYVTEHLIKGVTNALFGLSCPTETLCVAAGKFGQILTTTAPAATGLPEPPPPPPPPSTLLMHAPRKLIRLGVHAPAPTVAFSFKGSGVGPFWFRCKLDSRPGAVCSNPLKMRVGVGNHAFRVRAFGPGGGAPTQILYRFKVERLKPKPKVKVKPKPKVKEKHHRKGAA